MSLKFIVFPLLDLQVPRIYCVVNGVYCSLDENHRFVIAHLRCLWIWLPLGKTLGGYWKKLALDNVWGAFVTLGSQGVRCRSQLHGVGPPFWGTFGLHVSRVETPEGETPRTQTPGTQTGGHLGRTLWGFNISTYFPTYFRPIFWAPTTYFFRSFSQINRSCKIKK